MSNALERDLARLVREREEAVTAAPASFRQHMHLMPPVGWLNDPNGLFQADDGVFHAYFQYAPFDVHGGVKMWGHATSTDLLTWSHDRCVLFPDAPFDVHGVYSGSAFAHDGRVTMFYTGNVKEIDTGSGLDYVNAGRESNTVAVDTVDGSTFGPKRLLMTNADYPSDLTCHVRDPTVWRADAPAGRYLMVQGARRRVDEAPRPSSSAAQHGVGAGTDEGEVVVFASDDLARWRVVNRVRTSERFGFMWECPDYFELTAEGEAPVKVLSVCPQGLEGGDWERRNIYQAGYFPLAGDISGACELGAFHLWDAGFDYYAPQSFEARDGRRILVGWLGMPDAPYGNDQTVAEGWQHCLALPRELTAVSDGTVRQAPVRELAGLRGTLISARGELAVAGDDAAAFDLEVGACAGGFSMTVGGVLTVALLPAEEGLPQRLEMRFTDEGRSGAGCGRAVRWEAFEEIRNLRAVGDRSSLEVFVNDGELCMSTRVYAPSPSLAIEAPDVRISYWPLSAHR